MSTTANEQTRPQLCTVQEIAALLAVKESWVYSHVAKGDIPHFKMGRYVRFNRAEVLAWGRGLSRVG